MNLLLCGDAYIEEMWGGGRGGWDGGEGNQTGWTMRAHTDALCLMSRWHFCSPSPPHRPSLTRDEWAERKSRGEKERRKSTDESLGEDATPCLYFTQGHKPQTKSRVRVHRRASQSGGEQVWEGSSFTAWRSCSALEQLAPCCSATASSSLTILLSFWYCCLPFAASVCIHTALSSLH